MSPDIVVSVVVEGDTDEAVVSRVLEHVSVSAGNVYGRNGKPWIRDRMQGFLNASQYHPWVILIDLDSEGNCAPDILPHWLPSGVSKYMCFRVAVHELEAWLLSDSETLASFLSVPEHGIPRDPETLADPKLEMVNLARRSRRRAIREDMVPRPGAGTGVGPAYSSRLIEYASEHWRPGIAAQRAATLDDALRCFQRLRDMWATVLTGN